VLSVCVWSVVLRLRVCMCGMFGVGFVKMHLVCGNERFVCGVPLGVCMCACGVVKYVWLSEGWWWCMDVCRCCVMCGCVCYFCVFCCPGVCVREVVVCAVEDCVFGVCWPAAVL